MKVLYVTYNGLTEPLGRRQVLPYLLGLSERGWQLMVISFEKPETAGTEAVSRVTEHVAAAGIEWLPLRYHRRPTVPATFYDCMRGLSTGLANRRDIGLIHARSTVPALIAMGLSVTLSSPWIFDVRGLVAEEYADGGHWNRAGILFRLTHLVESWLLRRAHGLVFLTERIRELLRSDDARPSDAPTAVIPCCTDLAIFRPSAESRERVRKAIGLGAEPVLVYSGSLGSWYRIDEMMKFFALARLEVPEFRFLVLSPQKDLAEAAARAAGLDGHVIACSLLPDEVPAYLAAADAGICFLSESFSKAASSPTKYGEYLASGLPVVATAWTGDASRLEGEEAWVAINGFDDGELRRASHTLARLLRERERVGEAARALATREFALEVGVARYDELYRTVRSNGPRVER